MTRASGPTGDGQLVPSAPCPCSRPACSARWASDSAAAASGRRGPRVSRSSWSPAMRRWPPPPSGTRPASIGRLIGVVASAVGARHRHRPARRPSLGTDAGRRPRLAHRARGVDARHGSRSRSSPRNSRPTPGFRSRPVPTRCILVVATAAWWLATAVVIALIGLREARIAEREGDPAQDGVRRSAASGQASSR